jgi:hypothetical protein
LGTHREEIYTPYGPEEAIDRVTFWLNNEGDSFQVVSKEDDRLEIRRNVPLNPDIVFRIRFTSDCVRFEGWVQGFTKDPISSSAIWGGISRRMGWNDFQTLEKVLSRGVIPGQL